MRRSVTKCAGTGESIPEDGGGDDRECPDGRTAAGRSADQGSVGSRGRAMRPRHCRGDRPRGRGRAAGRWWNGADSPLARGTDAAAGVGLGSTPAHAEHVASRHRRTGRSTSPTVRRNRGVTATGQGGSWPGSGAYSSPGPAARDGGGNVVTSGRRRHGGSTSSRLIDPARGASSTMIVHRASGVEHQRRPGPSRSPPIASLPARIVMKGLHASGSAIVVCAHGGPWRDAPDRVRSASEGGADGDCVASGPPTGGRQR